MLDISAIRENPQQIKERLEKRLFNETHLIDKVIVVEEKRRKIQKEHDDLLAELNQTSRNIGNL